MIITHIISLFVSYNYILAQILLSFITLTVYLSGVVMTDKHKQWRDENIAHLLNHQPKDEDDLK